MNTSDLKKPRHVLHQTCLKTQVQGFSLPQLQALRQHYLKALYKSSWQTLRLKSICL